MNLNKVFLIGRLTAEPEGRNTPSGQTVVSIRLATNRVWNDRQTNEKHEEVEFHSVVLWGKLADIAQRYLRKGQMAHIEGRIQTRSWQAPDGQKRYRTEIVAENLQLGPKAMGSSSGIATAPSQPGQSESSFSKPATSTSTPAPDEEIPVINEGEPISNPTVSEDTNVEESKIDLKDIPF